MRKRKKDPELNSEDAVEAVESTEFASEGDANAVGTADDGVGPNVGAVDGEADDHVALVEAPEAAILRLTEEVEEHKDRHLRLAAEFDNFRKRMDRQRNEIRQNARSEVMRSILETLDNLSRVTALDVSEAKAEDVIEGVQMVERSLMRELEGVGLTQVGFVDERFDPNDHEAVATAHAPDEDKVDLIAAVLQVGYRLGDILLRPARVQVYVTPPQEESGD